MNNGVMGNTFREVQTEKLSTLLVMVVREVVVEFIDPSTLDKRGMLFIQIQVPDLVQSLLIKMDSTSTVPL